MPVARFRVGDDGLPADRDAMVARYRTDGAVVVENVFAPDEVAAPVDELVAAMRAALLDQGATDLPSDPDAVYQALWQANSGQAEACMGLGKDVPGFLHLISHPKLRKVISQLLGDDRHMLAFDHCLFRIDGHETRRSAFDWHQDYPFNVLSLDALTFWIPLRPVSEEMGSLRLVPGSHDRVRPVTPVADAGRFDPNRLRLVEAPNEVERWEAASASLGDLQPGSVALFDCKVLHRSGENGTDRFRWIANGRYGRLADQALMRRNWYIARTKYPRYFAEAHPDLVR